MQTKLYYFCSYIFGSYKCYILVSKHVTRVRYLFCWITNVCEDHYKWFYLNHTSKTDGDCLNKLQNWLL